MKLTSWRLTKDASNDCDFLREDEPHTNLLCRIGFCPFPQRGHIPDPEEYSDEDREFNRYTLLGEYNPLFHSSFERALPSRWTRLWTLADYFRAHMNRGVTLLAAARQEPSDIADLVSKTSSTRLFGTAMQK